MVIILGQQGVTSGAGKDAVEQPITLLTTNSSDIAGRVSHNLVLLKPIKKDKNAIMVYRTLPPIVNDGKTLEYAKKFNVTGTLKESAVVQSKDLRYAIEISKKSGSVRYMDQNRPNSDMDSPDKLPTDDDAIKIAMRFLKERDLYPESAVDPTPVRENAYTLGRGDEIYFGQIGVWYHRLLNGLKVEGTQLVVYVGGNGDVIGYYANWRNYEPFEELPTNSPETAFEQLKVKGVAIGMNRKDATVSIDDVYLAYQTMPGVKTEEYLQPVWVFKGNALVDGKPVLAVQEYIPALSEVPQEFGGPKPITSVPTTSFTVNLTTTQTIAEIVSVNETATPTISASPTTNTTSLAEEINQTPTLTLPTTTIITNTTTGFNATNGS
jgi:hypothetical protein